MKTLRCFNAAAPGAGLRKGNLLSIGNRLSCFILTIFLGLACNISAVAQPPETVWTDLGAFQIGYQLSTTSDTLYPNEHFSINLYLDVPMDTNCLGARFDVDCVLGVSLEGGTAPGLPLQSWLGNPGNLATDVEEVAGGSELSFSVWRTDGVLNYGTGQVLSAEFVVGNKSVATARVIESLGGGLIMEENVDMKVQGIATEVEEIQSWTAYPNPCGNHIQLSGSASGKLEVWVRDVHGRLLLDTQIDATDAIDTSGLPVGLLLFEIWDETSGKRSVIRVQKR